MDDLWIVLPHLGPGGAQKVGLLAAGHFAGQGFRVRVLTLNHGHAIYHRLPPGIVHMEIGADPIDVSDRSLQTRGRRFFLAKMRNIRRMVFRRLLWLFWPLIELQAWPGASGPWLRLLDAGMLRVHDERLRRLRALFVAERPQRVLALLTRTNIACCYAAWNLPIHLVVSERNDPRRQTLKGLWPRLRRVYYRRADVVTANTAGVLEALQAMGPWRSLELLPNPLPSPAAPTGSEPQSRSRRPELLSISRLVPQKGLDLLIRAFAVLQEPAFADWRLVLVGDGSERESLIALAGRHGLADCVRFEGHRPDTAPYLAAASVFVLPSRFEGMPNALLEAMAAGLPVVVSDASPGPLEVVEAEVSGLVVPTENVEALAAALRRLIVDATLRHRLGRAGAERLRALSWEEVEPHWRALLALPPL